MTETRYFTEFPSPLGTLVLESNGAALKGLHLDPPKGYARGGERGKRDDDILRRAREQLRAYFGGELLEFDIPLAAEGTDFQRRVWTALRRIPFGRTASYADVAVTIGQPTATRAVGAANGRNPIAIIVPCHRVIGANGTLTGYGGGLDRKKWLLDHEAGLITRKNR
jgi:methylated-DNA-[protein]-cysteine S-methyltransferase